MTLLQNPKKRTARRGFPIHAYVGANGGGKTAAMVWDTLPSLEMGRPVLSTVRLLDYTSPRICDDTECEQNPNSGHYKTRPTLAGREAEIRNATRLYYDGDDAELEEIEVEVYGVHRAAHPLWIPWTRWDQLLSFRFGDVLADEMTGVASSRESMSLPSQVLNHFQQLRRDDIPFRYTCPDWAFADVGLRRPTQSVTVCTGFFPKQANDEAGDRLWRQRRLFKWQTYDARLLDSMTEGHRQDARPEVVDWHYGPKSPAFLAYDTFDAVLQVGTITETGRCYRCGGRRRAPECRCDHHAHTAGRRVAKTDPAVA